MQTGLQSTVTAFPFSQKRVKKRFISVWELMQSFNAHVVLDIIEDLWVCSQWCANKPTWKGDNLTRQDYKSAIATLREVIQLCEDCGFKALLLQVRRDIDELDAGCSYERLDAIAGNLRQRIRDEYEQIFFLWVKEDKFYRKDDLFGPQVASQFAAAVDDIKEAGTCYALGRYTACVFHLQRVMEVGLKTFAAFIGEGHNPSWDSILKKIDEELKKDWKERKEFFKGDELKISDAAAMLRAVKTAWRNPTMHVDNIYDEEKAFDVWNAVKGFMNSLCAIIAQ